MNYLNMPTWLIYGLASSLLWGTYTIISKIVTSDKYLKVQPANASVLMLAGIMIIFLSFFLLKNQALSFAMKVVGIFLLLAIVFYIVYSLEQLGVAITFPVISLGLLQGMLWASGMIFTFLAFSSGVDAAKLTPIYNTNTLIAVILGISFLHELPAPDERIKVATGAILIVLGSILVS